MKSHSNIFWDIVESVCPNLQRSSWEIVIDAALEKYDKPSILEGLRALHEARGHNLNNIPHTSNTSYFFGILHNQAINEESAAKKEQLLYPHNYIVL